MPKPFSTTPNGFQLAFPNGWTISVQWGYANYCTNRKNLSINNTFNPDFIDSYTAEIAIWPTEYRGRLTNTWHIFNDGDGETVLGWQDLDSVMNWMNDVRGWPEYKYPLEFLDLIDPFGNHNKELEVSNYV